MVFARGWGGDIACLYIKRMAAIEKWKIATKALVN